LGNDSDRVSAATQTGSVNQNNSKSREERQPVTHKSDSDSDPPLIHSRTFDDGGDINQVCQPSSRASISSVRSPAMNQSLKSPPAPPLHRRRLDDEESDPDEGEHQRTAKQTAVSSVSVAKKPSPGTDFGSQKESNQPTKQRDRPDDVKSSKKASPRDFLDDLDDSPRNTNRAVRQNEGLKKPVGTPPVGFFSDEEFENSLKGKPVGKKGAPVQSKRTADSRSNPGNGS
jgi:hypothetical protein